MYKLSFSFLAIFVNCAVCIVSCSNQESKKDELPTSDGFSNSINLPTGFVMTEFATIENARSMSLSPSGTLFVGTRTEGKVFAVIDTNNDNKADKYYELANNLNSPNGVAFFKGDLYVAEISRVIKFNDIEKNLSNPSYEVVYDQFPSETHHGWKYIAFGPDNKLYVPVGAPCNICKSEEIFASITRMNPDGSNLEIVAHGVRNTVGFDWNPMDDKLWFTDNGRDMMGDNYPPCELNRIELEGQHFGYPYCHGGDIADPKFGNQRHCNEFVKPMIKFKAHTAPLGIHFYTGKMFPSKYVGDAFVAQHGSWNRSKKIGYRIIRVKIENSIAVGHEVFAEGWLDEKTQDVSGRPVDILEMKDGSLLVSDDFSGKIYRIVYSQ